MKLAILEEKNKWPLISAVLVILLGMVFPFLQGYTNIHSVLRRVLTIKFILNNCFLGTVIFVGWYSVLQKYQRQYQPWCYLLSIVVLCFLIYRVPMPFIYSQLAQGVEAFIKTKKIVDNTLLIAILVLLSVYIIAKVLSASKKQLGFVISLIVIACLVIGYKDKSSELLAHTSNNFYDWLNPFSIIKILLFLGGLSLLAKIKAISKPATWKQVMPLSHVRLALFLGVLSTDSILLPLLLGAGKTFKSYMSLGFVGLTIVAIVGGIAVLKYIMLFKHVKKIVLPIKPFYICIIVILSTVYAGILTKGIFYLCQFATYMYINSYTGSAAEAAGWFLSLFYDGMDISTGYYLWFSELRVIVFFLKTIFPLKTETNSSLEVNS